MRKALLSLVLSFIVFLQELPNQQVMFKSPRDIWSFDPDTECNSATKTGKIELPSGESTSADRGNIQQVNNNNDELCE